MPAFAAGCMPPFMLCMHAMNGQPTALPGSRPLPRGRHPRGHPRGCLHRPSATQVRRQSPVARIAEAAIGPIAQLCAVEQDARDSPTDRRAELRQADATPVCDGPERWLAMQRTTVSGKSPLTAAIRYALNRMERLRPDLGHGIPEPDCHAAERDRRADTLARIPGDKITRVGELLPWSNGG